MYKIKGPHCGGPSAKPLSLVAADLAATAGTVPCVECRPLKGTKHRCTQTFCDAPGLLTGCDRFSCHRAKRRANWLSDRRRNPQDTRRDNHVSLFQVNLNLCHLKDPFFESITLLLWCIYYIILYLFCQLDRSGK